MNSKEAQADPEHVVKWLRVITILVRSTLKVTNKLGEEAKLRYKALAQRAVVELIVQALKAFIASKNSMGGQDGCLTEIHLLPANAQLMPELVDLIFDQLMPRQRGQLVEAIVKHLEEKARVAFDCLDRLLDT